jgi:hypothetical protein
MVLLLLQGKVIMAALEQILLHRITELEAAAALEQLVELELVPAAAVLEA